MPLPLAPTTDGGGGLELDPSELNCEIRFESPDIDPDTGQRISNDWIDEGDDWAKIEPFAGRDLFLAMQAGLRVTHRVTTYWREGVTNDWRIVFNDRILNINRVVDVLEQNVKLEMICTENPQPKI